MDATLKALAALAVQAIPTVLFFIFLTFYLKRVYFQPIARILDERRQQTAGVRILAQQAQQAADAKTSEFETAIQLSRAQLLQDNEANRRQWTVDQANAIAQAREVAEQKIAAAKAEIAKELAAAQSDIASSVDQLSNRIVDSLTKRRAA